jgi:general secretion pathway protein G
MGFYRSSCKLADEESFFMNGRWRIAHIPLAIIAAVLLFLAGCLRLAGGKDETRQKESVLKENLYRMRNCIDQYSQDRNKAPRDLNDLVTAGYLRNIPKDPFTDSSKTWRVVQEDTMQSYEQTQPGIDDVHSGSDQISTEGTPYSSW